MRNFELLLTAFVVIAVISWGCSEKKNTNPIAPTNPGKITATASGIAGQNGSTYLVAVCAYDWYPGATDTAVAGFMTNISNDSFSSTEILHSMNSQLNISVEETVFEPGTYSVVFLVSPPDSPPQYFMEVRLRVNGDVTATAPAWINWTHSPSQ
jgi:predicted HTH transcriptional regulator